MYIFFCFIFFSVTIYWVHGCTTNVDCSRNGVCLTPQGICQCDQGWTGETCNLLDLLPLTATTLGQIYPQNQTKKISSWGGSLTFDNGMWHLLVAEMDNHCGLDTWQKNSFIRHASSRSINGPYEPVEIVMDVFSHNPSCMDASPVNGPICILLHIGGGTHGRSEINCSSGYTPASHNAPTQMKGISDIQTKWNKRQAIADTSKLVDNVKTITLPVMDSFLSDKNDTVSWRLENLTFAEDRSGSTNIHLDNPTGWVDKDGTSWLNYVQRGNHNLNGTRGSYGFGLAKANHWRGPYNPVSGWWDKPIISSNSTAWRNCEDSVLWRDNRGNFHMLFHYYGPHSDPGDHGGHAHAGPDGKDWTFTPGHPFDYGPIPVSNASLPNVSYGYRQRPHLVWSRKGEIIGLVTGVKFDNNRPYPKQCKHAGNGPCDHSWTVLQSVRTHSSKNDRDDVAAVHMLNSP